MIYTRPAALFLCLLFAGCASTVGHVPAATNVTGINLRPLTEAGFLVTPGDYTGGEFDAMGIVTVTVWPEANLVQGEDNPNPTQQKWTQEEVSMQKALEQLRVSGAAMGADALTHFKVEPATRSSEAGRLTGIRISGFAIDRAGTDLASE